METLDKFDVAILNELQTDGRLTNTELAQRVGLSVAPCWRRVRALEDGGYIVGYRAEINRQKIGLGVMAFVRLFAERNPHAMNLGLSEHASPLAAWWSRRRESVAMTRGTRVPTLLSPTGRRRRSPRPGVSGNS